MGGGSGFGGNGKDETKKEVVFVSVIDDESMGELLDKYLEPWEEQGIIKHYRGFLGGIKDHSYEQTLKGRLGRKDWTAAVLTLDLPDSYDSTYAKVLKEDGFEELCKQAAEELGIQYAIFEYTGEQVRASDIRIE